MKLGPVLLLSVSLGACGSEDVVVFQTIPGAGGAGTDGNLTSSTGGSDTTAAVTTTSTSTSTSTSTTGTGVEECEEDADCGNYSFCVKSECSAPLGECVPRPVCVDREPHPVCGCDGVTYWNDCVRQQAGVAASTPGECSTNAKPCDIGPDCGVFGGYCARILPPGATCTPATYPRPPGTCWAVPLDCQCLPVPDTNLFLLCNGPNMDPPGFCADTCLAIKSEFPHLRISDASECPGPQPECPDP